MSMNCSINREKYNLTSPTYALIKTPPYPKLRLLQNHSRNKQNSHKPSNSPFFDEIVPERRFCQLSPNDRDSKDVKQKELAQFPTHYILHTFHGFCSFILVAELGVWNTMFLQYTLLSHFPDRIVLKNKEQKYSPDMRLLSKTKRARRYKFRNLIY